MKTHKVKRGGLFGLVVALALSGAAIAQTESKVQSKAAPFGLEIAGPVMVAGSDEASAQFQKEVLPEINKLLDVKLTERFTLGETAWKLDPAQLTLSQAADVRVYFVGEGAGYQNTLGVNAEGIGIKEGDPELIFPNASSPNSYLGSGGVRRTQSEPLMAGDFVDLGTFEGGSLLDFFLIADGANGGKNVYSTSGKLNPDFFDHVVAFGLEGSPYLIIGFEDLFGGGDMDYNDLVFAVDIGYHNVAKLTGTPEPRGALLLGSLGAIVLLSRRRPQQQPAVAFA